MQIVTLEEPINKSRRDSWGEINSICQNNLRGKYKIIFENITDYSTLPEVLKFLAFDWENLKVLVYKEPQLKIFSFDNYNNVLKSFEKNKDKLFNEGLKLNNEEEYKRLFLFKNIEKGNFKELNKEKVSLKVGAFLNTSWGYDQTNVELFVIKAILGNNYFIIQEVAQESQGGENCTYYNVKVSPRVEKIDIPRKAFISNLGHMQICERGYKRGLYLTKMNEEHYKTNSIYGH